MRGFGYYSLGKVGWIEKKDPTPGPLDALVRPVTVCTCSSDVHNAYKIGQSHDRVLGHEMIARVDTVGHLVKDFKRGDLIIAGCTCPDWLNPGVQDGAPQHAGGFGAGAPMSGTMDGCFADKTIIRQIDQNAALIPKGMDLRKAIMVADMMTTGFHGVEMADVKFGDKVAVIGIGPVGLMSVRGAVLRGASEVFAIGTRPKCVEVAKEYGATKIVSYKDGDVAEQVLELTNNEGVDAVVLAGGGGETIGQAMMMLKPGGTAANLNVIPDETYSMSNIAASMLLANKKLTGNFCPGGRRRLERLLDMIKQDRVDPSLLVSHEFDGLDNIEQAFYLMRDKPADLIKPVIHIDD